MSDNAIIVAIVFGSILGIITIPLLISLAKKWIDRNNASYDEEKFDRLAKAFIEHKRETSRRLQHLEAIIAGDADHATPSQQSVEPGKKTAHSSSSSIEIDDTASPSGQSSSGSGNLRNMLKE